jgi:NAD(P)-dependent dehydrogenase (short-subunit alcohol dehydrogenase family)
MPRQNGFENKKVVIVGGSSGIGLAVAEEAASQGGRGGHRLQQRSTSSGSR